MTKQNKTERWEEDFDKYFYHDGENNDYMGCESLRGKPCDCSLLNGKDFISQLLSDTRREERERCLEAVRHFELYARTDDGNLKTERVTSCCESSFYTQDDYGWDCGNCGKSCSIVAKKIFKSQDDTKIRRNGLAKVLEENLEGFDCHSNLIYYIDRYYDKIVNQALTTAEENIKALSLPDQEQLEIKGK